MSDTDFGVKKLSIGEVQECLEEAINEKFAHMSLREYGIPVAFLRAAVPGFDGIEYEQIREVIEAFERKNPIAAEDIRKQIVLPGQTPRAVE